MHITPAGVRKNTIHPEHIIKVDLSKVEDPTFDPSKASTEFWMHYLLQKDTKSTRAVVHVHPTHVVAAMYAGWNLQNLARQFPEISRYTKVGLNVPFCEAGSKDLAECTDSSFRLYRGSQVEFDVVGQAFHGVCAVGEHPWDAYEHIERLDHICEIVLKSGVKP